MNILTDRRMEFAAESIIGDRANQQDAYAIAAWEEIEPAPGLVVCIADGMGGHAFGAEAARVAITHALDTFLSTHQDMYCRLQACVQQRTAQSPRPSAA